MHTYGLFVMLKTHQIPQKVPQGTNSDIDFGNDQLNPQKRKASSSRGGHDVEAGSSSAVGDPSAPPPKKKRKLIFYLKKLVETWRLPIEEVREIMLEYNVVVQKKKEARKGECLSAKLAQSLASTDESSNDQVNKLIFPITVWRNNTGF